MGYTRDICKALFLRRSPFILFNVTSMVNGFLLVDRRISLASGRQKDKYFVCCSLWVLKHVHNYNCKISGKRVYIKSETKRVVLVNLDRRRDAANAMPL
ncbi:hypothetical protein NQ317_015081 [Molorchus minor]|uniref:Ribosomal protein L28 n=1 Tax=Molorchus minor TaxID=1323400 RepID=A0ABQ9K5D2_9CUCU|nr:hypothetical protein NQ317_015081 [Molorchus minor]